mmetsp:Transcript_25238/g.50505  ORF Transcript_25238/g.50505 Transcript_25238/m.50505 type:complete len:409 (-) Transcript_25238:23-1249(-)
MKCIQMKLSIVRLDHSIAEIKTTSPEIEIESLSRAVFEYLSCKSAIGDPVTSSWNPFSRQKASCNCLKEMLIKSIMRYFKAHDQWTAFSSLLLKSIAFHRHIDPNVPIDVAETTLPIIDLPRTKFNRPFLPQTLAEKTSTRVADEEVEESRESVMNVSHQFPYVCMIQKQGSDHTHASSTQLQYDMIGCDLVIFEARLNKYSPTITAFLESFVGCFTTSEWQAISNDARSLPRSDDSLLKEFFLRWAMKEAYTKALGVGLNIDFDSFETRLIGHDVDSTDIEGVWIPRDGIWESITADIQQNNPNEQVEHQFSFVGQVIRTRDPNSDYWVFSFIPLVEEVVENSIQSEETASSGCICICKGPFNEEADAATSSDSKQHRIIVENLSLLDLIQLHGMKSTDIDVMRQKK